MQENQTNKLFLHKVIDLAQCAHSSTRVGPCWNYIGMNGTVMKAVCNSRAKRAGFNAVITESATTTHHKKKRANGSK